MRIVAKRWLFEASIFDRLSANSYDRLSRRVGNWIPSDSLPEVSSKVRQIPRAHETRAKRESNKRSFLFLQGPHGPFFKQMGEHLKAGGHRVLRVNFNGGDWCDWHGGNAINFTGGRDDWQDYVAYLFKREQITDLVLFGDCRSLHRIAIKEAHKKKLQVHVFEEGYIRPNWITCEKGGVNGNSSLLNWYDRETINPEQDENEQSSHKSTPSLRWILFYCLRYYLFKTLWFPRFRNFICHRPYHPVQELLLWIRNLLSLPLRKAVSHHRRKSLFAGERPFFLACLQLDSDAQLHEHSGYLSMADFISETLSSFAAHARKDSYLVFKKHPFDPGAIPYETLVRLKACSLGIAERVVFLHSGRLPELIKKSEGVVLMNSTVGTSALHHGRPTIALGTAIYDVEGLTWQGTLDDFWSQGGKPDMDLYQRFRLSLINEALVSGSFYTGVGRQVAIKGGVGRMLHQVDAKVESSGSKVIPLRRTGT